MNGSPTLVLLAGFRDAPDRWEGVTAQLRDELTILTPELPGLFSGGAESALQRGAGDVVAALAAAGQASVAVCGVGLGAMVALQLAADHPERVDDLVLLTRQVRPSSLLLSLPAAVLPLLPAAWVARLGAQPDQILALLDQVRSVDFTSLTRQVSAPALVLCGDRDAINRRASAALARELPRGDLQTVPDAGPGWLHDAPDKLVRSLRVRLLG